MQALVLHPAINRVSTPWPIRYGARCVPKNALAFSFSRTRSQTPAERPGAPGPARDFAHRLLRQVLRYRVIVPDRTTPTADWGRKIADYRAEATIEALRR